MPDEAAGGWRCWDDGEKTWRDDADIVVSQEEPPGCADAGGEYGAEEDCRGEPEASPDEGVASETPDLEEQLMLDLDLDFDEDLCESLAADSNGVALDPPDIKEKPAAETSQKVPEAAGDVSQPDLEDSFKARLMAFCSQNFKVLCLPHIGLSLEVGRVYPLEALKKKCRSNADKLKQLEEKLKDPHVFEPMADAGPASPPQCAVDSGQPQARSRGRGAAKSKAKAKAADEDTDPEAGDVEMTEAEVEAGADAGESADDLSGRSAAPDGAAARQPDADGEAKTNTWRGCPQKNPDGAVAGQPSQNSCQDKEG